MNTRCIDSEKSLAIPRIYQGDCIDTMRKMENHSINMILTDPPYLVNYQDRTGRSIQNDISGDWLKPAFEQMYRVLKPNSFCISFYGWNNVEKLMSAWKSVGFRPVGHLVWTKPYSSKTTFVGYRHESAYLLAKGNPNLPDNPISDVLDWKYSGNKFHPTQKPVLALTPLIKSFSKPNDIVLDPFAGSGSTAVAALTQGRNFIGCELEAGYCETVGRRIETLQ